MRLCARLHLMSEAGLCHAKTGFELRDWLVCSLQCPNTTGASEVRNATGGRYASAREHHHFVALQQLHSAEIVVCARIWIKSVGDTFQSYPFRKQCSFCRHIFSSVLQLWVPKLAS